MKPLACLVALALLTTACQSNTPTSAVSGQKIQSATTATYVPIMSPILPQVKVKPDVKVSVQGTQVKLEIKLPALSEYKTGEFQTQALDLATAAKITATVKDSYGKTYTPVGAVAGQVAYPPSGVISLVFNGVVPDKLLFVELQVTDGAADIPQADLAVVLSHTGITNPTTTMDFLTSPGAKAMKALLAANATRARLINLTDLDTLIKAITGVTGTAPNYVYATHPTLVDTAQLATDLATQDPSALTASAASYRLSGATVGLTVSGLVGSDKIEVQSTDAASAVKLAVPNGASSITGATPGTGLKIKVGGDVTNSTQYTFAVTPSSNVTLTNGASTPVTIVATPSAVTITGIAPTAEAVGNSVTITGTGFSTTAANNTVKFGTTTATVTAATATTLTVTVPTGIFGAQSVTVSVGAQTSGASAFNVKPVIATAPANATVGASISITGSGFSTTAGNNTVKFGTTNATVTAATTTSLTATVPAGAGAQNITVTVAGQVSNSKAFNVTPVLTSLTVANGIVGSSVVLNGSGFDTATLANNVVSFGGTNATVTAATATTLTVMVPNTFGGVNVNVSNAGQTSTNKAFAITPNITSLLATTGSSGDTLDINGTGFDPTVANNTVKLGSTTLTATMPSAGKLRVTVPGNPAGTANATVQVGAQTSAASSFAILPKLSTLTTVDAIAGKAALIRGNVLTIAGLNFDPTVANNSVSFTLSNSAVFTATAATVNAGGTQLTVVVPAGVDVSGDVAVKVITNSQNSNSLTGTVPTVSLNITNGGFH